MKVGFTAMVLLCLPVHGAAQQACQPLQGTSAHATCLNEQLARNDPRLKALEPRAGPAALPGGFVAPELLLSERSAPVPLAHDPAFGAAGAAARQRLELSTRARGQALSGRIGSSLSPRLPAPRY